jgi:hypothetical protein
MFYLMLASGSFSDEHPALALIGLVIGIVLVVASLSVLGNPVDETIRSVSNAVKNSDWYKTREDRKEIEAMERQLKKKELKKRAGKTRMRKRETK